MAKHEYQQQRGTVAYANSDGTFAGSGRIEKPSDEQPTFSVAAPEPTTEVDDDAVALLDAGVLPVGVPMRSEIASSIDFDGDDREGLYQVYYASGVSELLEGQRGDVRREVIGTEESLITFTDESGNRFEKDDYVSRGMVVLQERGRPIRVEENLEGVDHALDFMAVEVEYDADHARAFHAMSSLYHDGVAGEDDVLHAVGHLVYLHGEVEDGADAGDWSTPAGTRALRQAFFSLTNSLPVEVIRKFAYEEHGRLPEETDRLLENPDANPFL